NTLNIVKGAICSVDAQRRDAGADGHPGAALRLAPPVGPGAPGRLARTALHRALRPALHRRAQLVRLRRLPHVHPERRAHPRGRHAEALLRAAPAAPGRVEPDACRAACPQRALRAEIMETRTLGQTGLRVSALGFGASELGWDQVPQADVDRLLGSALDAGLTAIDTAACYFDSEEKLGRALAGRPRDSYHLFTKCGHASGLPYEDWTPELVGASIERSLRRLGTDYLDLVQLHSCSAKTLRRG